MTQRPTEFDLIRTYFAPLSATEPGAFSLTDDAAIITPPSGKNLVITTDALVENVHFLSDDLPEDIAAKLLRVSLSDLASMGAEPAYYSLAIAVTPDLNADWFKAFTQSLAADQKEYGISLIGGDTVSTNGPLTFSLTAMGYVEIDKELRRSGAQLGDDIWVSGTLGDAALGLKVAQKELTVTSPEHQEHLLSRYRRPLPRTVLSLQLVGNVHSVIDISDGLIADLGHICETSNKGADIYIEAMPLSDAARSILAERPEIIELILSGGDDYELLFTADGSFDAISQSISDSVNVRLTKIGKIVSAKSIRLFDQKGEEVSLIKNGFTHF